MTDRHEPYPLTPEGRKPGVEGDPPEPAAPQPSSADSREPSSAEPPPPADSPPPPPPPASATPSAPRRKPDSDRFSTADLSASADAAATDESGREPIAVPLAQRQTDTARTGLGEARIWAVAGAILLLSALIATGVTGQDRVVARIGLTLYNTLLHTGTGVVALFVAALLLERRLGSFELAAARMFTAVAAFAFLFHLNINLLGERLAGWKIEEVILAIVAYIVIVAASFGLWRWRPLAYVVGAHFVLWLILQLGMELSRYVGAAGAAA